MTAQQRAPGALFTIFSVVVATIVAFVTLVPVIIVNAIYTYIHRPNFIERNKKRGEAIKNICLEMGVPSVDYNRIVTNRNKFDFAKQIALKMGEPDGAYPDESWNNRLAYAIVEIYSESQNQTTVNPTTNDDVERGEFIRGLNQVSSDFQLGVECISYEAQDKLSKQAMNIYFEKDPRRVDFVPVDYFMDALLGTLVHDMRADTMYAEENSLYYSQIYNFLQMHQHYRTNFVVWAMNEWAKMIIEEGTMTLPDSLSTE